MCVHLDLRTSEWTCIVEIMNTNEAASIVANKIEKSRISVSEVALKSGIPRTTLIRKMHGGGEFGVYELVRIAAAIGIKPSMLLPKEYKSLAVAV